MVVVVCVGFFGGSVHLEWSVCTLGSSSTADRWWWGATCAAAHIIAVKSPFGMTPWYCALAASSASSSPKRFASVFWTTPRGTFDREMSLRSTSCTYW
eukprot:2145141-Prymnesium_polylepis.1